MAPRAAPGVEVLSIDEGAPSNDNDAAVDTIVTVVPGAIDNVTAPPASQARVTAAILEHDLGRFSGKELETVSLTRCGPAPVPGANGYESGRRGKHGYSFSHSPADFVVINAV
jgi:hypothetical protein